MNQKTPEVNPFGELLSILGEEELIRFAYRLRKAGKVVTAEILAEELAERELMEQALTERESRSR